MSLSAKDSGPVCWIPKCCFKTYPQSDHRLVVAKVRLKLKAKRRRMQRELRHQVDMKRLEEGEVEEFRRVFAEELGDGQTGGGVEVWITFKEALREA